MVQLKPVTPENIDAVLALDVREDQRGFVSSTAESLAQAYVYSRTAAMQKGVICGFHRAGHHLFTVFVLYQ